MHYTDIHLFSNEDLYELSVAEALCCPPSPSHDTFIANQQHRTTQSHQMPGVANGPTIFPTNPTAPAQPTVHTTFNVSNPAVKNMSHQIQTIQAEATHLKPAHNLNQNGANTVSSTLFMMNDYNDIDFCGVSDPCTDYYMTQNSETLPTDYVMPTNVILHSDQNRFIGFCLDSGAASSVSGVSQFKQFLSITQQPFTKIPCQTRFRFGNTIAETTYRYKLRIPLSGDCYIEALVAVIPLDIPFLLVLEVLTYYGLNLEFYMMQLRYQDTDITVPITIHNKHAYINGRPPCNDHTKPIQILFNRHELRKLHLHFFHPTPTQICELIRRARPADENGETLNLLKEITSSCEQCQEYHSGPMRFRVALPPDSITFNADVAMDLVWLDNKPVIHIVDLQTRFQNA